MISGLPAEMQQCQLVKLPSELLCTHILTRLDARSLAKLEITCSFFSAGKTPSRGLAEQAASQKLITSLGSAEASRFTYVTPCDPRQLVPLDNILPVIALKWSPSLT